MAGIKFKVETDAKRVRSFQNLLNDAMRKATVKLMTKIADDARSRAPVDTGALKTSISITTDLVDEFDTNVARASALRVTQFEEHPPPLKNQFDGYVSVPVRYASYIEFGARGRPPHFLFLNADSFMPKYRDYILESGELE